MSLNFSGTAQGPHPEGLSWITGALNLAMAWCPGGNNRGKTTQLSFSQSKGDKANLTGTV